MTEMTIVKGLQSEINVPLSPEPVWVQVEKDLQDMTVAMVTAAGVHRKQDKKFNLAGDHTFREIPNDTPSSELMVTHGGYDNADANKDVNCMFPLDRLQELVEEGLIKAAANTHFGFMGGGGDQVKLKEETGPAIVEILKNDGVDAVVLTAG